MTISMIEQLQKNVNSLNTSIDSIKSEIEAIGELLFELQVTTVDSKRSEVVFSISELQELNFRVATICSNIEDSNEEKLNAIIELIEKETMEAFLIGEKFTMNDKTHSLIKHNQITFNDNILTWSDDTSSLMWEVESEATQEYEYTWKEALKYAEKLNQEKFAGFNDWRLPTILELKSLIRRVNPGENEILIPLLSVLNGRRLLWSADSEVKYAGEKHGLYLSFTTGREHNGYTKTYSAICVRTIK